MNTYFGNIFKSYQPEDVSILYINTLTFSKLKNVSQNENLNFRKPVLNFRKKPEIKGFVNDYCFIGRFVLVFKNC